MAKSKVKTTSNKIKGVTGPVRTVIPGPNQQQVTKIKKLRGLAVPDGLRCLEASTQSKERYLACGKPADFVVRSTDNTFLPMCGMCTDHNVKNRGAKMVYADEPYTLLTLRDLATSLPEKVEDPPKPPVEMLKPIDAKEVGDVAYYVGNGMERFRSRLASFLDMAVRDNRAASELASLYVVLRDAKDEVESAFDQLKDAVTKMSEESIPAAFEREDIKSFTTGAGHRVTLSTKCQASILKDNRDEAYVWLRSHKLGDLIVETVMASTLSAAAKKELEEGRELPESLFTVHFKVATSLTKAKAKK